METQHRDNYNLALVRAQLIQILDDVLYFKLRTLQTQSRSTRAV